MVGKNDQHLQTKLTSVCVCATPMWFLALGYFLNCQAPGLIKWRKKATKYNENRTSTLNFRSLLYLLSLALC